MSSEENKASANLIILCLPHSKLIDKFPDKFSVEDLLEWKRNQQVDQGIAITQEEADEIVRSLVVNEYRLEANTINIGGQHGGGGGAIGDGAIGGRGGDSTIITLDGASGRLPGEGGGGGGVLGPSTSVPPDGLRANVGRGFSDGSDGMAGGTTSFGEISSPPAASGMTGTGTRSVSSNLTVSAFFFASSAEIREGFISALGGGLEQLSLLNAPSDYSLLFVAIVEAGHVPAGEYSMHIDAASPAGIKTRIASFPVSVETPGELLRISRWQNAPVHFDSYGLWRFSLSSDAKVLSTIGLSVRKATDPLT